MTTPGPQPTPLSAGAVSPVLPTAMILTVGTLWGLAFSFSKMAAGAGVHGIAYSFWQALGAGIVVTLVCLSRGLRPGLRPTHLRYYLTTGVLGLALPSTVLVLAVAHLPVGVTALTIPFVPLITYALAVVLKMERFSTTRFAGVLFGLAGVAMIVLPRASLPDADAAPWFLIALLTPVSYATNQILAARLRPEGAPSPTLAAGMLMAAALLLTPIVILTGLFHPLGFTTEPADIGIWGQIAVSCIAYVLMFEILRLAGPVFMSLTGYIVTLTGIGWGVLIFDESHSPLVWGAAALIFTGLALVNFRRNGAVVAVKSGRPGGPTG